jgi:16S rRNA (cytidine1402-2'-O)-methyltransferase
MATLFVVATPIGNLGDLTPRAARVLSEVQVIAAESLNRTKKLLSHLGIRGQRLISCREANRKLAAIKVREALDQGFDVALVSDAGTPGISDPGGFVVAEIADSGHRISPLPGPSSLAAAISVAGWPGAPFVFLGFLPAKPGARRRLLKEARDTGWPFAFFEGPHRLADTVRDLAELLGGRKAVLAREISKINEEVVHSTCQELAGAVNTQGIKGEITVLVAGGEPIAANKPDMDELLRQGLAQGTESPSRLAKTVAAACNRPRDEVYRRLLLLKGVKN